MIKVVVIVLLVHKIKGGIGAKIGRFRVIVDIFVFVIAGKDNAVKCSTGTASYEIIQQKEGERVFTVVVVVVVIIRRRG
jgi:hypothetical protein